MLLSELAKGQSTSHLSGHQETLQLPPRTAERTRQRSVNLSSVRAPRNPTTTTAYCWASSPKVSQPLICQGTKKPYNYHRVLLSELAKGQSTSHLSGHQETLQLPPRAAERTRQRSVNLSSVRAPRNPTTTTAYCWANSPKVGQPLICQGTKKPYNYHRVLLSELAKGQSTSHLPGHQETLQLPPRTAERTRKRSVNLFEKSV